MTISPIKDIVEFLELKEALCRVVHEHKAKIKAESFSNPFWVNKVKIETADDYAKRISESDDLASLRRQILGTPKILGPELQNEMIKEANRQAEKLEFLKHKDLKKSPDITDLKAAARGVP